MFHPDTQFLIDRWSELARSRDVRGGVPARERFTPESLGARLPRAFLLQGAGAEARLRLAGGWLEALHGRPLAGRAFLDLWCEASPVLVAPAVSQAVREGRPVVIVAQLGPRPTPVEVVVAPLRGRDGQADLLLRLVAPAGEAGLGRDESRQLAARVTIGVGNVGRPDLRLVRQTGRAAGR